MARRSINKQGEHIVVTGIGRTGTTFLVRYFTLLGFDTGFSQDEAMSFNDPISAAGLEHTNLRAAGLPYVVKSPWYADQMAEVLTGGQIKISVALIPMRDLTAAAESRRRVYREAMKAGLDPLHYPGTLWKTSNPGEQEVHLALQFYRLIEPLVAARVPIVFLHYPGFVLSHDDLFEHLQPILADHGITQQESLDAHRRIANPRLVHDFGAAQ